MFRDGRGEVSPCSVPRWADKNGALAQLGEHLLCKQGVIGSIPIGSTSLMTMHAAPPVEGFGANGSSTTISRDEERNSGARLVRAPVPAGFARIFDIVNGFLIDAATWRRRSSQRIGEERVAQSG